MTVKEFLFAQCRVVVIDLMDGEIEAAIAGATRELPQLNSALDKPADSFSHMDLSIFSYAVIAQIMLT